MAETPTAEPQPPHPPIDRGADSALHSLTEGPDSGPTADSGPGGRSSTAAGSSASLCAPETICPICQRRFAATGTRQWCSPACKTEAWRRANPSQPPPTGRPAQQITVYACRSCGARHLQRRQHCTHCDGLMRNLGVGGPCPQCATLITIAELLHEEVVPQR